MTTSVAILLACLTLLCISVHDRLARARDERRIELQRQVTEANNEAVEALAVRATERAREAREHQAELARETQRQAAEVFKEAHREAAEAWHGGDEPWRNG